MWQFINDLVYICVFVCVCVIVSIFFSSAQVDINKKIYIIIFRIFSTYRCFVFVEHLVVLWHGNTKYDRRDIFEAMNPFFPFWSLTTNVKQSDNMKLKLFIIIIVISIQNTIHYQKINLLEIKVFKRKMHFYNTSGFYSGTQYILFCGLVIFGS